MKPKTIPVVAINVVFAASILLLYTCVMLNRASRNQKGTSVDKTTGNVIVVDSNVVDDALGPGERSLREKENWSPRDFFDLSEAIGACEAIAARDESRLKVMIGNGLDVNMCGKAGMTLLFWAYVCGNLDAFEVLLESGADPDRRLTAALALKSATPLSPHDTILFTCVRHHKWRFFFAALSRTHDVNQHDGGGLNLIQVAMNAPTILHVSPDTLQRLIDAGIALDERDEYGGTAAISALAWERPAFCLQLLKAGANPVLRDVNGRNLTDYLMVKMKRYEQQGNEFVPQGFHELYQWIKAYETREPAL